MKETFFWKRWNQPYRIIYVSLLALLALSIIVYAVAWFTGDKLVFDWATVPDIETIQFELDSFTRDLLSYTIDIENHVYKEYYEGSIININPELSYIFLLVTVLCFLVFLTTITFLDLIAYGAGILVFIAFLVGLDSQLIGALGKENQLFLTIMLVAFAGLSYAFQAFLTHIPYLLRFLSFIILTVITGFIVQYTSNVEYPFLYLANFGIVVPVIVSGLFIILVAYDIPQFFLYITTSGSGKSSSSSAGNFLFITILYLANLGIALYERFTYSEVGIFYINPFILIAASGVLGIWGFKKREVHVRSFLPFRPYGAIIYLCLGIITFTTIGFSFATANDPLIRGFHHFIIYTHFAIGLMFLIYVLYNFGELFKKVDVYKYLFQPSRAPYFLVYGLGLVSVLALILFKQNIMTDYVRSGKYNLAGDALAYSGDYQLAREYYHQGMLRVRTNHRSNYSLATIAVANNDYETATEYYIYATNMNPSPFLYTNLGNIYRKRDMFFESMFRLKDGLQEFPDNGHIMNNLGLLYSNTGMVDSSLIFLHNAHDHLQNPVSSSNLLAVYGQKKLATLADTMDVASQGTDYTPYQANRTFISNMAGAPSRISGFDEKDLDAASFLLVYNLVINNILHEEEPEIALDTLINNPVNEPFKHDLIFLKGLQNWYLGEKAQGYKDLQYVIEQASHARAQYYSKVLGMLLFREEQYSKASSYLLRTESTQENKLFQALAMLQTTDPEYLRAGWGTLNELSSQGKGTVKQVATNIKMAREAEDLSQVLEWGPVLKLQLLSHRLHGLSEDQIQQLYNSFNETDYRVHAAARLMEHYISQGNTERASAVYEQLTPGEASADAVAGLNYQYLRLLAKQGRVDELEQSLEESVLPKEKEGHINYFQGLIQLHEGDTSEALEHFTRGYTRSPYHEENLLEIVNIYNNQDRQQEAYDLLLEALDLQPENVTLLQEYALQALKMQFMVFAEDALEDLERLMRPDEYSSFRNKYRELERQVQEDYYSDEDIY